MGVKRVDKWEELREEAGVKGSFRGKLVRSWLKWAGYMERMEGERLTKTADVLRVDGRRPRLRWEDCVNRDLAGLGVEWRSRAKYRGVENEGEI